MQYATRIVVLCSVLLLLSHCSPLSPLPHESVAVFTLSLPQESLTVPVKPNAQAQKNKTTLLIALPRAHPIYRTKAMIYNQNDHEIQQFTKHRWIDQPAKMLQPLLVQVMMATPQFFTVVASPFSGRTDYRLESELIDFAQAFHGNRSDFRVTLLVHFVDAQTQRVLASRQFTHVQTAHTRDAKAGVVAANAAVANVLQQVSDFVTQNS